MAYEYALVLMAGKNYTKALEVLLLFVSKHHDNAVLWFLIGQCEEVLGDFPAALDAFTACVKAHKVKKGQPDKARAYFSLGSNLFRAGRTIEAMDAWKKGLNGECVDDEAKFVRSQVNLALGNYEQGWKDYEGRKCLPGWKESVKARVGEMDLPPAWDGTSEGRVLVYGEQGAGDVLQFGRYLTAVHAVSVYEPRVLAGKEMQPMVGYEKDEPCVYSAPICSLPFLLGITAPLSITTGWWEPPVNRKPRVGVCWKGSPTHMNDRDRSSPIDFRGAFQDEAIEIVSLQVGEDFSPRDYKETAELMLTLDAVVTVDTSVVHVAGTVGVPTILIPPSSPEWRWGVKGETSAWYPSVRIVRRYDVFDWGGAISRATKKLREIL